MSTSDLSGQHLHFSLTSNFTFAAYFYLLGSYYEMIYIHTYTLFLCETLLQGENTIIKVKVK